MGSRRALDMSKKVAEIAYFCSLRTKIDYKNLLLLDTNANKPSINFQLNFGVSNVQRVGFFQNLNKFWGGNKVKFEKKLKIW